MFSSNGRLYSVLSSSIVSIFLKFLKLILQKENKMVFFFPLGIRKHNSSFYYINEKAYKCVTKTKILQIVLQVVQSNQDDSRNHPDYEPPAQVHRSWCRVRFSLE